MTESALDLDRAPTLGRGSPWPLGASCCAERSGNPSADENAEGAGVNFAVWAPDASRIELCLFDADGVRERQRVDLPACTDGVWHGLLPGAGAGLVYGLRAHGPWAPHRGQRFNPHKVLLDPWAREVVGSYGGELERYCGHAAADAALPDPEDNAAIALKARVVPPQPLAARLSPAVPADQTVLYEAHVKALTMLHPGIPAELRGSFAALGHPVMVEHLRKLGVTTLSLMPVQFRADEAALQRRGLSNHWGYASIAWLAPEPRLWSGRPGTTPADEFRAMVEDVHAAGLEVVLDMVFNHTAEGDELGPTLSLRGLANARYYHLDADDPARYRNWTGCGNSVDLSEPRVVELVLGALRHWVECYGVDGFRLDLAASLARGRDGHFSTRAGFFAAIQADPVLARVKWIAEPWDIGPGGYQLGAFPPGWMEWNDQYRDTMRAWWLHRDVDRGGFAQRFAASGMQFHHSARAPTASVNFLTAHDGFTLRDLVSYDHKHNLANGEFNRDGHHHNLSWNCGVEGPTSRPEVQRLRRQLQGAMLATLLSAQGTPMLLAGDEIGHSQGGNNNAYCQDNETTWLNWDGADHGLAAMIGRLLALRRALPALRQPNWLAGATAGVRASVRWWHPDGRELAGEDWHASERVLGIELLGGAGDAAAQAVLVLVNAEVEGRKFTLPPGTWQIAFDSGSDDVHQPDQGSAGERTDNPFRIAARTLLVLRPEHGPASPCRAAAEPEPVP